MRGMQGGRSCGQRVALAVFPFLQHAQQFFACIQRQWLFANHSPPIASIYDSCQAGMSTFYLKSQGYMHNLTMRDSKEGAGPPYSSFT